MEGRSARGKVRWVGLVCALLFAGCGGPTQLSQRAHPARVAGSTALAAARSQLGAPYRFGGASPATGFDCSGLVLWSYRQQGVSLPRSTRQQIRAGRAVARTALREGDLVFFQIDPAGALHVGLYAGDDSMVHSPKSGGRVRQESLRKRYWQDRYRAARRID
jgi:cell wall-associated NlpC family hydrolase